MGFFDHLQKGGAFSLQPQKNQIRKVVQTRPAPAKSAPNTPKSRSPRVQPSSERSRKTHAARSVSSDPDARPSKRLNTPTRVRKRPTPEQRLSSDDDASDSDASFEVRKRARTSASAEPDPERRVRSVKAFSEEGTRPFKMVHATDITSTEKPRSFKPAFGAEKAKEILLQYPSASQKERYGYYSYHLSRIVLTSSSFLLFADSTVLFLETAVISDPSTTLYRSSKPFPITIFRAKRRMSSMTRQPGSDEGCAERWQSPQRLSSETRWTITTRLLNG